MQRRLEHWRGRWKRTVSARRSRESFPPISQSEYRAYRTVHPFDEQYGVDTAGLLYDLPTGNPNDAYNNGYFGVAPSIFHQIFQHLNLAFNKFSFLDLGSGKGRALLLASDYPFREVIGVEISPALHRVAIRNIARYQRARKSDPRRLSQGVREIFPTPRAVRADAAEFPWPSGPLVVYIWNAFTEPVMRRVLANLQAARAAERREIYLVYVHPELEALLQEMPGLERVWFAELTMSEDDYAAWAFPTHSEICAVYRAV